MHSKPASYNRWNLWNFCLKTAHAAIEQIRRLQASGCPLHDQQGTALPVGICQSHAGT